jgi:predicted DNA-binding transcriptional regulator AlpA
MTRFLRKAAVAERYGGISDRTIERMVKDKRLPPPEFPFGNRIPAWREDVLDAHDRAATLAPKRVAEDRVA